MTIDAGDVVHDFELPDQDGIPRRLSTLLADGPVVLFFYPAAMTSGCTAEACAFRDLAHEFRAAGAQRVGISHDTPQRQKEFDDRHNFGFLLLSDAGLRVAEDFGVKRRLSLGPVRTKRMTFVIDTDRTVLDVIASETNMREHAERALTALTARRSSH